MYPDRVSETHDDLARLRRLTAQIRRAEEKAKPERDQLISRLRSQVNPATGKLYTWERIAEVSKLSRIGAIEASKRATKEQAA
jgi:hypothetical protein